MATSTSREVVSILDTRLAEQFAVARDRVQQIFGKFENSRIHQGRLGLANPETFPIGSDVPYSFCTASEL